MKKITCKLIALTFASVTPLFAQPQSGDWEFTLGGSGSADQDFNRGGFGLNGGLGYFFNPNLEVGVRQNFSYNSSADTEFAGATTAAVDWHFQLGKFVPFVGANIGMSYNSDDIVGGIGPEAGFKYYVQPQTFIMVMGEYRWFFSDLGDIHENADSGSFAFTVGIGFNFGRR